MKTFKLILKSLISNNSCIEGGRKKPWYFAAIMLFLSMVFAILPLFVQLLNTHGDDVFKTYTYGADVATLQFTEKLNNDGLKMYVKTSEGGTKFISCEDESGNATNVDFHHDYEGKNDFNIYYRSELSEESLKTLLGEQKISTIVITQESMYMLITNINDGQTIKSLIFDNVAKYLDEGRCINDLLSESTDPTEKLNQTFANWKLFIKDAYKFKRLTIMWKTCALMGGINLGITLFMGLMVWILTRGKNNPYRLFNLWETQKMAWWAAITPSLLALALGFLIPRFANILFPMLIGIRVMWLSMKSLRPDGSGYAEAE